MSLIRYAAQYHKGLGWAVYDFKFRQKAAANRHLSWSAIDSQLWLKTFTVAPSVLKEEAGILLQDPFTNQVQTQGSVDVLVTTTIRGSDVHRTHARFWTYVYHN